MAIPAKTLLLLLSFCIVFYCSNGVTTNSLDESYYDETSSSQGEAMSYLAPRVNITSMSQQQQQQQRTRTPSNNNKQIGSPRTSKSSGAKNSTRRPTVRRIVHPSLHAAWDESNRLCALAKFQATFTIKYEGASGSTSQLIDKMPPNARSKGRCDQFDDEPVLDIIWKDSQPLGAAATSKSSANQNNTSLGFTFRVIFQKFTEDDDRWGVQQMQLLYNTGHPIFRGVSQPKKVIVRSNKDDYRLQFRTNIGSSLLCPSPPPIQMYDSDGQLLVIARLSNMQLQAFQFSDSRNQGSSNFDAFERCGQVSFGSGVARQNLKTNKNDGLTFMIGLMTVCIATLTVVGYAVYRSNALKTKQYKTMSE